MSTTSGRDQTGACWSCRSVGGVLQHVVAAGGVRRAEKQAGPADEFVCAVELGTVAVWYVGHTGRLVSSAEHRRSAVFSSSGSEVA
eukprot:2322449-Pleurochrysis_carterae.AAC.1